MKNIKFFTALLLLFLITVNVFAAPVLAVNIEKEKDVSLTVSFKSGNDSVSGALFNVYLIAQCDEYGNLTVTDEFSQFSERIQTENSETYKALALDLDAHATALDLVPADSGRTDENGKITFPTTEKKLSHGLYLVDAPRHINGDISYDTTPLLVMLPAADRENNLWVYDVNVSPKFSEEEIRETVTRKVLKIWDDKGLENERPEKITVNLLKDGKIFETVTLSSENNWSYKWEDLDGKSDWSVTEESVEGYTASVSREGITFVIKNTPEKNAPR